MKTIGCDMLYLSFCALNGIKPDSEKIEAIDLEQLYKMCKFHSMTAIVCMALESAGICDEKFMQAKSKAIRKNILLDAERERICEFMERNRIWYMPLKGVVLKELYPRIGMRQMSDNDILYDKAYQEQLKDFMMKIGYTPKSVGVRHHDEYLKSPIYNFEMHTSLMGQQHDEKLYNYYKDVKKRLIKNEKKEYAYHFSDEDFYVFMTVHEYKHYSDGGTGLRSLMDCYVYIREKGQSLNWNYITQQLEILGINEFENRRRKLSEKVFSNPDFPILSEEETKMFEYYLFSGTYGTINNSVEKSIKKIQSQIGSKSKIRYILKRLFPDLDFYRHNYPFFYHHKFLLPIGWLFRLFRGITVRRKKLKVEINILNKEE